VTPQQAQLWVREIDKRRRQNLAMQAHAMRLAIAAAFDKNAGRTLSDFIERLTEDDETREKRAHELPGRPAKGPPPERKVDEEKAAGLREMLRLKEEMDARGERLQ